MNEIDQILSNIEKDDDDKLFHTHDNAESKKIDDIVKLIDTLDERPEGAVPVEKKIDSAPLTQDPSVSPEQGLDETAQAPEEVNLGPFSLKGSKSWNRREPYLIRINPETLKADHESLEKSFFFVEEETKPEDMNLKIKQEIVAFLRRPSDHITERYEAFIYKMIISAVGILTKSYKVGNDSEKLFIYHAGPLTIYKYIRDTFSMKKYGYCYKYLPGNKASRFFPEEFIKEVVMKWFEENINTLDLQFDSIQKYEEIKKAVSSKYYHDLRIFNGRLEQLNEKLGKEKGISRNKLFQLKGGEWFGQLNIEVYRRFLGGTIFM